MAIALTCSSCNRKLRVKDELAGRKVKCPDCGVAIPVPGQGDDLSASLKSGKRERADEDDEPDEEERPRKKKKKKKARNNTPLIIGAAVGGLVLVAIVVLLVAFASRNEGKQGAGKSAVRKGSRAQAVGRALDLNNTTSALKRLGLALHSFIDTEKHGPSDPAELSKYFENDAAITQLITNKQITVLFWGLPKERFLSSMRLVIAYETAPDQNGIRLVLRGFGGTEEMNEAEFQAAPKLRDGIAAK